MNLEHIKTLCKKNGEKKVVEYKTSTSDIRSAFETVCAFLNTKGGTVLIGVKDDGKIIGQHISDNTRREIAREIKKIEPATSIEVDYIDLDNDKVVIAIHVEVGEHAPYTYDGRPWQRDESETNRMSQHRYEQLLVTRGQLNHSWEDFIAENYNLDDLDHEEIYRAITDGIAEKRIPANIAKENVDKILRQLSLYTDDGKIKRAAVVLFAKKIKAPYTNCWLKMARFKGTDKGGSFIDNQQERCHAFHILEIANSFLHKHLPMASYFKQDQFKRIDKFALPILAIREALVNAICHRDYTDRSGYISIAIFDDRVEIWNNGNLPNKLKLEDLKRKHDSILRNELIADIFYLRGYIEAWGTGIKKMMDSCKEHGIPAPKFSERTGGIVVTFKLSEPIGSGLIEKRALNSRQEEIIKLLQNHPKLNVNDVLNLLKTEASLRTISADLSTLKKLGYIEQQGMGRSTTWRLIKK